MYFTSVSHCHSLVNTIQLRLSLEKLRGDNSFQPGPPETSKFRGTYTYKAANVSKFGVCFLRQTMSKREG